MTDPLVCILELQKETEFRKFNPTVLGEHSWVESEWSIASDSFILDLLLSEDESEERASTSEG